MNKSNVSLTFTVNNLNAAKSIEVWFQLIISKVLRHSLLYAKYNNYGINTAYY